MSSEYDRPLEVLLACFEGHKRAAKVHHPLSKQIKAEVAEILDEAVLTVTPKGKARVYDPRRVVAGMLTPALTWGVFTLLGGGTGWSVVIWVVMGAVCGGLYAYYYEHLAKKDQLARLGEQLPPDSSAVLACVAGAAAGKLAAAAADFGASPVSVATIGTDLSATVLSGRTVSPAGVPAAGAGSVPADRHTLLTMLLFRYPGSGTAKRVHAEASGKPVGSHPAIETELLLRTDTGGRRHVVSPSAGVWASAKGDIGGWAVFGAAVGLIAGFGGNGGLFGALEKGVVTGIVWAVLGLAAGALYGLWAGRSISARRLNSIRPILPPDTSMVIAWAEGAPQEQAVIPWSAPGSQQLILRFESAPHGAVLDV
jgi:uncharacterized membrane protein